MPETYQRMHCGYGHPQFANMLRQYGQFMPYDLEETENEYVITMPLPGFSAENIDVSISGKNISIEANPPKKETPPEGTSLPKKIVSMSEFVWNRPIRVDVPVNEEIEGEEVKAHLKNGLLSVKFHKKPKKTIKVEEE